MTLPQARDARALYTPRLVLILALQFVFGLGYSGPKAAYRDVACRRRAGLALSP